MRLFLIGQVAASRVRPLLSSSHFACVSRPAEEGKNTCDIAVVKLIERKNRLESLKSLTAVVLPSGALVLQGRSPGMTSERCCSPHPKEPQTDEEV